MLAVAVVDWEFYFLVNSLEVSIGIDYAQGYYLGNLVKLDDLGNAAQDFSISETQVN